MEVVLKAVNLHKSYKAFDDLHILKGISLELKKNESIAIMGSSGAGKTTLLHILGTLESFDSGKINILNSSSKNNKIRNKHIGFIFQSYNLIDDLTLLENVLMPALIARKNILSKSVAHKRAQIGRASCRERV